MMTDLERDMRAKHRQVQALMAKVEEAKVDLLEVVLDAVREGYSLQTIADILGLSKSRAQQLVRQADGRGRSPR